MIRRLAVLREALAVLLVPILALWPVMASAQVIRYVAPAGTYTGGTITSPILAPAGTASAPSYSFSASTGLGIYRIDSNTLCLTAWGSGCNLEWDGNAGLQIGYGQPIGFSSGATTTDSDLFLYRDAANTLAQRNGTAAQTFNLYDTYTDASNYSRLKIYTDRAQDFTAIFSDAAGTGTLHHLVVGIAPYGWQFRNQGGQPFAPTVDDTQPLGTTAFRVSELYLTRSIQGSKTKALTESSATTFVTVAVPQTAGSNYAAGRVGYTVYAADATDSQTLHGVAQFSAVNKAGTETCAAIADVQTAVAESAGGSTLTCTITCVTGLTDVVGLAANCVSSLTQTTLTIQARLDLEQPNTLVFP